jgi:hypothetical protein
MRKAIFVQIAVVSVERSNDVRSVRVQKAFLVWDLSCFLKAFEQDACRQRRRIGFSFV